MIYMTHYADNWRSWNKIFLIVFIILEHLCNDILFFFLFKDAVVFKRYFLSLFKRKAGIYCNHLSLKEKILNNVSRLFHHLVGKFLQGNMIRNRDCQNLIFISLRSLWLILLLSLALFEIHEAFLMV